MYDVINNQKGRLPFKMVVLGLAVVLLCSSLGWWAWKHESTESTKTLLDIRIPLKYTQPLVIAAFNNFLEIRPVNARGARRVDKGKNTIKYIDAYPETDVEQIKYPNKLKESLILKTSGHPDRFEYELNIDDYLWEIDEKGDILFKQKEYEDRFEIDEIADGHIKAIMNTDYTDGHPVLFKIPKPFMVEYTNNNVSSAAQDKYQANVDNLNIAETKKTANNSGNVGDFDLENESRASTDINDSITNQTLSRAHKDAGPAGSRTPETLVLTQESSQIGPSASSLYHKDTESTQSTENTKTQKQDIGEVEVKIEGDRLILIPDQEWIKNHNYPIVVDPTIEINVLNVYSYPQQGETWQVDFITQGQADLKIIPADQATIEDDEFIGLYCGEEEKEVQVLENDVIYYPNWQCNQVAKVVHYTLKAGKHHLIFDFGGVRADAFNDSEPWWNTDFSYRKKITFDNTDQSTGLSNFPAVATSTAADTGFWSHVQDDYRDLRFINDDGDELYFEIEEFDYTNDDLTAWVKLNFAHATTTDDVWMYYGHSGAATTTYATTTGVWDENYVGVWHMGDVYDSSRNALHGDNHGAATTTPADLGLGDAFEYEETEGDYILVAEKSVMDITHTITITAWAKPESYGPDPGSAYTMIVGKGGDSAYDFYIDDEDATETLSFWADTNDIWEDADAGAIDLNIWQYMVVIFNEATDVFDFYVNGVDVGGGTESGVIGTNNTDLYLGATYYSGSIRDEFDGILDEVRVSNTNRTADWVTFEYCNMIGGCTTYGAEQQGTPDTPSVADAPDPTNPGRSVTFTIDWVDIGDQVKAKVCKGDSLTSQICDDGHWASSTAFTAVSPIKLTYDVVGGDHGQTRNYYVFTCDDDGQCSSSASGTFSVNVKSSVPNVKIRGDTKVRGGTKYR